MRGFRRQCAEALVSRLGRRDRFQPRLRARRIEQCDDRVARDQGIDAGDQPVDRLYVYRVVVQVDQLDHRVPRRMARRVYRVAERGFDPFPCFLRRGKGMVAIAHRVQERFVFYAVFFADIRRCDPRREFFGNAREVRFARDQAVCEPPAVHHEFKIRDSGVPFFKQGVDDFPVRIVDEHEGMWAFERCVAPNLQPRFEVFGIRALGCADEGFGLASAVVVLQVERDHQPLARFPRRQDAVDEQKALDFLAEHPSRDKAFHVAMHALNPLFVPIVGQIDFGIDEGQRRRRIAHNALDLLPIRAVVDILIAGDHGPLLAVDFGLGQQNFGHAKRDVVKNHDVLPKGERQER